MAIEVSRTFVCGVVFILGVSFFVCCCELVKVIFFGGVKSASFLGEVVFNF